MSTKQPFLTDVKEIQKRARQQIEQGAVTPDYQGDVDTVIRLLNEALATEIVCTMRYRQHYYMAVGIHYPAVAEEFLQHSNEEAQHADQIAERIRQLNGHPDFSPNGLLGRSHSQFEEGASLIEMIKEDLVAERIAIETYREIIQYLSEKNPTTRRVMERILEKEEEHADDMATLLQRIHHESGQPLQ